jgi:hypothetical protein
MSRNERPESFDIDLLKQEERKDLQASLYEEMMEAIVEDSNTTKENLKDILIASYSVGIEQAIEDYYNTVYK